MLLDGQTWGAPISETPELGATEEWLLLNPSMDVHPIHIHLVQFQLVQRQALNGAAYMDEWTALNGTPPFNHPTINVPDLIQFLSGSPQSPQPNEECWKDTIIVNSGEAVTIRVRFAPQDGSSFPFDATAGPGYVWHCHLLEHEDNEMMRPYKITAPKASVVLPLTVSAVAAAAAAAAIGYSYQRVRKKRQQTSVELNFLGDNNETDQYEEIGN